MHRVYLLYLNRHRDSGRQDLYEFGMHICPLTSKMWASKATFCTQSTRGSSQPFSLIQHPELIVNYIQPALEKPKLWVHYIAIFQLIPSICSARHFQGASCYKGHVSGCLAKGFWLEFGGRNLVAPKNLHGEKYQGWGMLVHSHSALVPTCAENTERQEKSRRWNPGASPHVK